MVSKEEIRSFPDSPGVYLMKDHEERVIYVGKALSLKKRVGSYFLKSQDSIKTQVMLSYVRAIEYLLAKSEHDALILEADLIKRYRPRFNISLKDDKSFPYIKVTREEFPRVFIGRRKKREEGLVDYFGPYTSAKLLRRAVTILRRSFPFCTCRRFPKKVCLNFHMGLCAGPYQKKISKKGYLTVIKNFEDFLSQKDSSLIDELSLKMRDCVRRQRFEEAAGVRDQLEALSLLISLKKFKAGKAAAMEADFGLLGCKSEPRRIEAFDISNIGANQAVGSMVSFYDAKPDKNNYRRFRIKTVAGIDDYAMIREVVRRRYERLLAESKKMPDLIVIDGGAGHLDAAFCVLRDLKLNIPIISIAKNEELIYTIKDKSPLKLERDSLLLQLIQRVRDEAHRFALNYHRFLRKKDAFRES
jgi:excinuclease ABC subunit C